MVLDIVPGEKYGILGDADRLKQMFINILSNAVKFSKVKGKIFIGLSYDKDYIFVKIKDNGIGLTIPMFNNDGFDGVYDDGKQ